MLFREGDMVEIVAGADRNTRGKVLKVFPRKNKVVIEGVNRVYKHVRRSQKNPQGGRLSKEMPIDASNAMLICPQSSVPTRVGIRTTTDGGKERYSKKSGAGMGQISPPKDK